MRCITQCLWEEIKAFANHVGCEIEQNGSCGSRPKSARRSRATLDDYVLTGDTIGARHVSGCSSDLQIRLYFPTLDPEMRERLNDTNTTLIKAFDSLRPVSNHFLDETFLSPMLQHYNIPSEGLEAEVLTFRNVVKYNPFSKDKTNISDLLEILAPLKDAFPILN